MTTVIKVFLFLAIMVCISTAQVDEAERQCLCRSVRNRLGERSAIKDIQIYQKTVFCNKVEIVVTNKNGLRFCLNPDLMAVKKIISNMLKMDSVAVRASSGLSESISTEGRTYAGYIRALFDL